MHVWGFGPTAGCSAAGRGSGPIGFRLTMCNPVALALCQTLHAGPSKREPCLFMLLEYMLASKWQSSVHLRNGTPMVLMQPRRVSRWVPPVYGSMHSSWAAGVCYA